MLVFLVLAARKADVDFKIKRPVDEDEIKEMCELCQINDVAFCCPEHCCDVSFFSSHI